MINTQPNTTKLTSKLEYLQGELKYHKKLVEVLEQECVKLYAQLKVLDKESNNEAEKILLELFKELKEIDNGGDIFTPKE